MMAADHTDIGINLYMEINNHTVSVMPRCKTVEGPDTGSRPYNAIHALNNICRQRPLKELGHSRASDFHRYYNDKHTHNHCGNRIEYAPLVAKKHSAGYTHKRGHRRQRIAAVMPGIGNHNGRMNPLTCAARVAVEPFFRGYRRQSH